MEAFKSQWIGKWAHGRVKSTRQGPIFVLEKKRDGRRYAIPLEARNEGEALNEWKAWNADPEGPAGAACPSSVEVQ